MVIGEWLRRIGLGQYEAKFQEHEIDLDVLPDLTEADLRRLGLPLGPRRRLTAAIAELERANAARGPSGARPTLATLAAAVERRPLTIMFCDFEAPAAAAQFDVEDWNDILGPYLAEAREAVSRFEGRLLPGAADGLMATFGYRQAQENDAERAVRAALAIQQAATERNAKAAPDAPKLVPRIGLESGRVVIDSAGGVFGQATSVAARVQAAADRGTVLITADVQRQIAGLFIAEDRGEHELKGVPHPVHLYRIVRVVSGRRRLGARTVVPFAGREPELDLLFRGFERARSGEGQLVLIVGEPGIGKSRLLREFQAGLSEFPHSWIDWDASQLLQNSPLHPAAEWGRLRFDPAKPPEERLAELELVLIQVGLDGVAVASLIAPLLEIPLPPERTPTGPPDELRQRQLATLESWILTASRRLQPTVFAFEDLQWSDPSSLDLLVRLAESGAGAPVHIVATARPEFSPPWRALPHHARINLAPLDPASLRKIVVAIASNRALPEEVVENLSERAGGVPLFVEEITRLFLERGEEIGVRSIPPTLQQSLAARLDRLGLAREIAETAAVLGRDFSYALVRDVSGWPEAALRASLERLVEADILLVGAGSPPACYRFKHALIQDAAYENLLTSHRQALHLRAAETLRDSADHGTATAPETIAHHFTQSGRTDLAVEWWTKAGDQALKQSAFREANAHLGKAIELADATAQASGHELAESAVLEPRLKLLFDYAQAVGWSKGFAAEETKAAFERAIENARADSATGRFLQYNARWVRSYVRGEFRSARDTAEDFLRDAESASRATEACVARRVLGLTCLFQGEYRRAERHLERAITDTGADRDRQSRDLFNVETRAAATTYLALIVWHLGDVERAGLLIDKGVGYALETGHVPTIVNAYAFRSLLEVMRGDPAAALAAADTHRRLSREHGITHYLAFGDMVANWARGRLYDPAANAAELQRTLDAYMAMGNKWDAAYFFGLLGKLEADAGDAAGGLARIDEGLRLAEETGEYWCLPELHRLRGEALRTADPASCAARDAFQSAIEIARRQGALCFELRAALAMAKLHQASGRTGDARAPLVSALKGFPTTADTPEIAEARALMANHTFA